MLVAGRAAYSGACIFFCVFAYSLRQTHRGAARDVARRSAVTLSAITGPIMVHLDRFISAIISVAA